MSQTIAIHQALRRLIRQRGFSYRDAAEALDLSLPSVKRLMSRGELSLSRLEALCNWLRVDFADLVDLSRELEPLLTQLSLEQERELVRDPALLLLAYLTFNHWSDADILATYRFTPTELTRRLIRLERLGLIEVLPFGRIKRRTARNFTWQSDGPVQHFFTDQVLPEFLQTRFDEPGEHQRFVGGMLSRGSIDRLRAQLDELLRNFDELIEADRKLPIAERYGVSLLLATRPWEFSGFTKLRRGPRAKFF
jgi:transcriptional regulator with XRE-family HTH domain